MPASKSGDPLFSGSLPVTLGLVRIDAAHLLEQFLGVGRGHVGATRAAFLAFFLLPRRGRRGAVGSLRELCAMSWHRHHLRTKSKLRSNVATPAAFSMP